MDARHGDPVKDRARLKRWTASIPEANAIVWEGPDGENTGYHVDVARLVAENAAYSELCELLAYILTWGARDLRKAAVISLLTLDAAVKGGSRIEFSDPEEGAE